MDKDIELTIEQTKFLAFLRNEMRLAEQKRHILQEIALKLVQFYAIELKVPNGWRFNQETNAFIAPIKPVED